MKDRLAMRENLMVRISPDAHLLSLHNIVKEN
jgi:hypothetical protein